MPNDPQSVASQVVSLAPPLPLITLLSYDGSGNVEYLGKANPGSATSSAVWQIKKFAYDGSGNLENILTAYSGAFRGIWDNRAGLTYA